jgi:hypothetical protein
MTIELIAINLAAEMTKAQASIAAANAMVEGMKIANAERYADGKAFAYDEEAFCSVSEELLGLHKFIEKAQGEARGALDDYNKSERRGDD